MSCSHATCLLGQPREQPHESDSHWAWWLEYLGRPGNSNENQWGWSGTRTSDSRGSWALRLGGRCYIDKPHALWTVLHPLAPCWESARLPEFLMPWTWGSYSFSLARPYEIYSKTRLGGGTSSEWGISGRCWAVRPGTGEPISTSTSNLLGPPQQKWQPGDLNPVCRTLILSTLHAADYCWTHS